MRALLRFLILVPILAVVFGQWTGPAAAAACDHVDPPSQATNNIWYCWRDGDTAIVFVHGLHSSSRAAWLDDARPDSYWPRIAATDPSLQDASVFLAGFFTDLDSTTFGMREASGSLNTKLNATIDGHAPVMAKKNILFVAHSLGGILVRDLLTRYKEQFAGKRIGILLVASPSSGSNVINKLSFANAINGSLMVDELSAGSRYLKQLDDDFKTLLRDPRIAMEGREVFEQYWVDVDPSGLTTYVPVSIKRRWKPLVPADENVKYFIDPQQIDGSDHITIAKPTGLESSVHQKLVQVFKLMLGTPSPTCSAPPDFEIQLDIKTLDPDRGLNPQWPDEAKAVLPQYKFVRRLLEGDLVDPRSISRDKDTGQYFYKPRGSFPCRGDKFDSYFSRVPAESKKTIDRPETSLCFRRSFDRADEKSASLACTEGANCAIDSKSAGLADPCLNKAEWRLPAFIATAHAATEDAPAHWEVPSLETLKSLPEQIRTGYAEFSIVSPASPELKDADSFTYALAVNGATLYVDGLQPHAEHFAYAPAQGLKHTFALENLGFTGGTTGFEEIVYEIKLWSGKKLVRTDRVVRHDYVSYRHAAAITSVDEKSGQKYEWSGLYRPAKMQAAFEVILAVGNKKETAFETKRMLDGLRKDYDQQPVVGVIRPGRKENKTYGTSFGLRLPTGQVKSLFTEEEADKICKWVLTAQGLPAWMRKSSYQFKFPAERFNELKDRGQYAGKCT